MKASVYVENCYTSPDTNWSVESESYKIIVIFEKNSFFFFWKNLFSLESHENRVCTILI